jgi:uncharacterized protein
MISIVLKVTRRCNSRCRYCFERRQDSAMISLATLSGLLRQVNELLTSNTDETVELLWHGGEPLLAGPGLYLEAARLQDELCPQTRARLRHSIQTNATLLTERFSEAFRRLGMRAAGISVDPLAGARGLGRSVDNERYLRAFLRGVSVLERLSIVWGVNYVVTQHTAGRGSAVLSWLTNLGPRGPITILPLLGGSAPDLAVSPAGFAGILAEMFAWWWPRRHRLPLVEPFASAVRAVNAEAATSLFAQIVVGPDGRVSSVLGSSPRHVTDLGELGEDVLASFVARAREGLLAAEAEAWQDSRCQGCRWWPICRGNLSLDSFAVREGVPADSEWCHARREFLTRVVAKTEGKSAAA